MFETLPFNYESKIFRTEKAPRETFLTSVRDHMLICHQQVDWEDFKLIASKSDRFILELNENLFIKEINLAFIETSSLDSLNTLNCFYFSLPF